MNFAYYLYYSFNSTKPKLYNHNFSIINVQTHSFIKRNAFLEDKVCEILVEVPVRDEVHIRQEDILRPTVFQGYVS